MENLFKNQEQIKELIQRADDEGETKRLTEKFKRLKKERNEFYLTLSELDEIFKWKLRSEYGRQTKQRNLNTNENIISI
ncbi:hypothetical protein [Sphingobacterium siyangense]|uniref:hypothetical protein n=1 Tax=Sphingobacterium siyangense TaxID=459529 RepID=UPI0028A22A59|nr:hypothetical protein [Sphingobacterium siyangense]